MNSHERMNGANLCPRPLFPGRTGVAASGLVLASLLSGTMDAAQSAGRLLSSGRVVVPYLEPETRFTDVACGDGFTLALRTDGAVVAWGSNFYGQCAVPGSLSNVVAIGAGGAGAFSIALKRDGTVEAWGGRMASMRAVPPGLADVIAISAGDQHSLALKRDGTVVGWGNSADGRRAFPVDLSRVVAIAAGGRHSLVAFDDGSVKGYGYNLSRQVTIPSDLENVVALAAGARHSVALQRDGRVRAWNSFGGIIAADAVAIAAGGDFSYGVRRGGTVVGSNSSGVPAGLQNIARIASSPTHSHNYALRQDGTLVGWGTDPTGQWPLDLASQEFISVASSADEFGAYTLALTPHGSVVAWGENRYGQVNVPPEATDVRSLVASPTFALALRNDGRVISWGANALPTPPDLKNVVAIAAGPSHRLALQQDGTVIQWGSPLGAPQPPAGLIDVVGVACGSQFSLALRRDGTVIRWGPTTVPAGLDNVTAVAAAAGNSLALKANGTVVGWGSDSLLRQVPPDLDEVVAIAISETHALALRSDGNVVRWGRSITSGQVQSLPEFKDVVAIAAGPVESFGIRAPLRFTRFEVSDGLTLHFRTFKGRDYLVQASGGLEPGSWTPLTGGRVAGTGGTVTVLDGPPGETHRFYRLLELPAEASPRPGEVRTRGLER